MLALYCNAKLDTYYECMVKLLFAMQKLKGNMKRIIKMTFTDFLDNMIDGQAWLNGQGWFLLSYF